MLCILNFFSKSCVALYFCECLFTQDNSKSTYICANRTRHIICFNCSPITRSYILTYAKTLYTKWIHLRMMQVLHALHVFFSLSSTEICIDNSPKNQREKADLMADCMSQCILTFRIITLSLIIWNDADHHFVRWVCDPSCW